MSFPWKGRTCANQHFWGGSEIGTKKAGMDLLLGYEGEWIWEIRNLCENHDNILLPSVGVQTHTTRAKAGDWYVFVELCDVPVVGFSKDHLGIQTIL